MPRRRVEVESVEMRRSALAHSRSTPGANENDQRTSEDEDDVPGTPDHHPPPLPMPDQPARRENKPLSVELEGEKRIVASCDVGPTSDEAEAPGALPNLTVGARDGVHACNSSGQETGVADAYCGVCSSGNIVVITAVSPMPSRRRGGGGGDSKRSSVLVTHQLVRMNRMEFTSVKIV